MVTRRTFMQGGMMGLLGAAAGMRGHAVQPVEGSEGDGEARTPMNIICFLCDDMGAEELGCYGNRVHQTPHLDALAAGGVRFETFYATPVCSPTRVSLMTGRYGFRTGWCNMRGRAAGGPRTGADLARDERNFAQLLRDRGYATGFAGKWQLTGDSLKTMLFDAGFDESLMWIYTGYLDKGVAYKGGYYPPGSDKSSRYWHPGLARNGEHFETSPEDYGPDMFSDFCIDFIRRNHQRPLFLYYPMALIHKPWQPTPDTPDLKGENREPHLKANVEYADKIVGRIVSELDALGIRENTLVLFIGDNGTQGAGKSTPTEWGARVPFIVNAPGVISGGQVSRELSDISDVLPTMLDFAGAPQPADITLDGVSLAPYLTGASENHREFIFSFLGHYRILRDRQWLLEQNTEENFGQMFYCGESRDGRGYEDVTGSAEPGALAARERFEQRLKELPVPVTTPEARREFEAQTAPKIETLNRHLQKLDPGIRQRSVPVVARKKGQRSLADKEEED